MNKPFLKPNALCFRDQTDRARVLANRAISHGWIIRQTACEVCGSHTDVVGHHVNYQEPYNLHWLCPRHHRIADRLKQNNVTYSRSLISELSMVYNQSGRNCLANNNSLHIPCS